MPVGGEVVSIGSHLQHPVTGVNSIALGDVPVAGFTSRDDAKKQRELEEARKSGMIPAEKDEEGKDINPHIPQYIAKAPWYLSNDSAPSLKHQRYSVDHQSSFHKWYKRGLVSDAPSVLKYRKGACQNCGALTHAAKDCTERPRKVGAKWTGRNIRPDELIVDDSVELELDFDGKRDRYGGYDPSSYRLVVREFELADIERKKRKAEEIEKNLHNTTTTTTEMKKARAEEEEAQSDSDTDSDNENEDLEDVKVKDFDQTNAPIGMKDDRTRTTMMNLRIREDTAKYLFNLDVDSAFYDPKSRSMRENPLRHLKESEQGVFRGDNAVRHTGEADVVAKMEIFAWEAYKHDSDVHTQARPTQIELMHKEHSRKKQELVELKKKELLEKYNVTDQKQLPNELLLGASEVYLEYSTTDGSVKRIGQGQRLSTKSKYSEDCYVGDHTSIYGSFYDQKLKKWGYLCCKCLDRFQIECK